VKDENGDLLADSHNILNRRKNYFSQLLNVHRVSDVKQIEIHTAEPLVPDPVLQMNEMSTSGYNPIYEFLTKTKQNIQKSNLFQNSLPTPTAATSSYIPPTSPP
jgi:hypothetical protein